IFAGAGTFEFLGQVAHPKLPFEHGERLVALYVLLLTLTAAAVAGVTPALKATRELGQRLRQGSAGGGGLGFGGMWTAVIVTQIAVTVTFPAVAFAVGSEGRAIETFDPGIPTHEYLTAQVVVEAPEVSGEAGSGGGPGSRSAAGPGSA